MAATNQVPTAGEMDGLIAEWIQANAGKISQVRNLEGGWEVWAQVELALFLSTRFFHYTFTREQRIFADPGEKVDIWLQRLQGRDPRRYPNIGVELKCRSKLARGNSFKGGLLKDMEKVLWGPSSQYNSSKMYAVGISTDPDDLRGFASVIDPSSNSNVFYSEVVNDQINGSIYMIWWVNDFDD